MLSCLDTSQPARPHYNLCMYLCISEALEWAAAHCTVCPGLCCLCVYVFSPLSITAQTICARVDGIMRPILYLWIFPPHLSLLQDYWLHTHLSEGWDATIRPQILSDLNYSVIGQYLKKGTWLVNSSSDLVWPIIDSDCCSCLPIWPLAAKLQPRTSR